MASRRGRREPEAIRITTAPASHHDDVVRRRRRYLVSMAVRTACVIGAVLVNGWLMWVLLVGAVFLPYVAVVMANAASPRVPGTDLQQPHQGHRELG